MAKNIASRFTLQAVDDCDLEFSIDALGEFLNILLGHLIDYVGDSDILGQGMPQFDLNLSELQAVAGAGRMLAVEMDSQIGSFIIAVLEES